MFSSTVEYERENRTIFLNDSHFRSHGVKTTCGQVQVKLSDWAGVHVYSSTMCGLK